jgi:hypothetical protein
MSRAEAEVRRFGTALFDAVFRNGVRVALSASIVAAENAGRGLRLRLRLADCPELADLPWEYLFDPASQAFLALSEWTPVVRYLDVAAPVTSLPVAPPLSILVQVASPADAPRLDAEAELDRLHRALRPIERSGLIRITRVPGGSLAALQDALRHGVYHVFHFIGHGAFSQLHADGFLLFEGGRGAARLASGPELATLLAGHHTLRLAVLNACEGARSTRTDPFSGVAQSLVRGRIPAVVAMQFEITDEAAAVFARELYEAVADDYPLEAAVAEARKALRHEVDAVEWGTPVLHLRAPTGDIFTVKNSAVQAPSKPPDGGRPATGPPDGGSRPAARPPDGGQSPAKASVPAQPPPPSTRWSPPRLLRPAAPLLLAAALAGLVILAISVAGGGSGGGGGGDRRPFVVTRLRVDGIDVSNNHAAVRDFAVSHEISWLPQGTPGDDAVIMAIRLRPRPGAVFHTYAQSPPEPDAENPGRWRAKIEIPEVVRDRVDQVDQVDVLLALADPATAAEVGQRLHELEGTRELPPELAGRLTRRLLATVAVKAG